jgi:hypothetical protein
MLNTTVEPLYYGLHALEFGVSLAATIKMQKIDRPCSLEKCPISSKISLPVLATGGVIMRTK